jgi:hypothetical protein
MDASRRPGLAPVARRVANVESSVTVRFQACVLTTELTSVSNRAEAFLQEMLQWQL